MNITGPMQPGKCAQCGAANGITALSCSFCGAALRPDWDKVMAELSGPQSVTCGKCKSVNHAYLPTCLWCGEPLPEEDPLLIEKRKALFFHLLQETLHAIQQGYSQGAQDYIGRACLLMPKHKAAQDFRSSIDMINASDNEQGKRQALLSLRKKITEFLEGAEKH